MASSRSWQQELADYSATTPSPVADLAAVVDSLSREPRIGTSVGAAVARLSATWTQPFAELVVTAAELAELDAADALALELTLNRLSAQRAEDRFFSGAAAHRADWPQRRALGEAQEAVSAWRQARTGCAGCGQAAGKWPTVVSRGIGPSFFIEHWCRTCGSPSQSAVRVIDELDFTGLHDIHGRVAVVGSEEAGYTLQQ